MSTQKATIFFGLASHKTFIYFFKMKYVKYKTKLNKKVFGDFVVNEACFGFDQKNLFPVNTAQNNMF